MQTELLPAENTEVETLDSEAAWLQARRHGIGASEAAAVLGLSPYKTAFQLFCEKLEMVEPDEQEREALYWGKVLEPYIARRYSEVTGRRVAMQPAHQLRRSRLHPFMVCTLDALTWPAAVPVPMQIKNVTVYKADDWQDEPPVHVQIQEQHEMAVTGAPMAVIVGLVGGNRLVHFDVARNDRFIAKLILAEAEFWQRCQDRQPPAVDGAPGTKELLRNLYPQETPGLTVALPGELVDVDTELRVLESSVKGNAKRIEQLKNTLRAALGEAECGVLPNGIEWRWKAREVKGYTVQARIDRVLTRKEPKA